MLAAIRGASSLVMRLGGRASARLFLVVDEAELLADMVLHNEAGAVVLDAPGRREAAYGHGARIQEQNRRVRQLHPVSAAEAGVAQAWSLDARGRSLGVLTA
jgi:hypothetical protein